MEEINTVAVDLHVKRYSDFDLLRLSWKCEELKLKWSFVQSR